LRYDLVDLKLFVAVADAGNVSRGAAACFLAPSSASLRITKLEESLGAALFVRGARGVSLTRAGQVMLEHCRRCLAELEQMHADLAPYAEGVKAQVTLFANSSAIASFLPDDLETFLRAWPEVRVSLEERLSHDIVAAVAEGRADLGVVTWDDEHPALLFAPYREDQLVVVAPHSIALGEGGSVAFAECISHPFVSLWSGSAIHTYIVGKAAALGHPLDIRIQVAGFPAVVALVRSGAGIGIVPRSVLRNLAADGLSILTLRESWAFRQLKICSRRDDTSLSRPAKALLAQLGAIAKP
jgi:DNA-binding transcriptional LysR family regulator